MNINEIVSQLRGMIASGGLEDAANQLVRFFDEKWISQADKAQFHLYNQALHQLSQLNELKHSELAGVISRDEADLKRNKIRTALLEIIEELGTKQPLATTSLPGLASFKHEPSASFRKLMYGILIMAGILVIGIAGWYFTTQQGETPQSTLNFPDIKDSTEKAVSVSPVTEPPTLNKRKTIEDKTPSPRNKPTLPPQSTPTAETPKPPVSPLPSTPKNRLTAGSRLNAGEKLVSTNGRYEAIVQEDGNFVVYAPGRKKLWETKTQGHGSGCYLDMQVNGDLALYSPGPFVIWTSKTSGAGNGCYVEMQDNGDLALYKPGPYVIWNSKTAQITQPPNPIEHRNRLTAGSRLNAGEKLVSTNGRYEAIVQEDGNFVVYAPGRKKLWETKTQGHGSGCYLDMQVNGDLALYSPGPFVIWTSKTSGAGNGCYVEMQNNGDLALYKPGPYVIWNSKTAQITQPANPIEHRNRLTAGSRLNAGEKLVSTNGRYEAIVQEDGNFVVYAPGRKKLWETKTQGHGNGCYLDMQVNGDLALYSPGPYVIWTSNTSGAGNGCYVEMQDNGDLALYKPGPYVIWNSKTAQ